MTQSMSNSIDENGGKKGRETIHSGQFMVSHFEPETKEDDDEKIPIPDPYEENDEIETIKHSIISTNVQKYSPKPNSHQLMIETSLSKLFNCMQVTYKQKLTSPKWNHFKGIRLSWKDKIRLNNLIWRCWHSQFMKKKYSMCQFASPIDIDLQIKPEAIVLEGKYWKRDSRVVCAEYRKWRKYYIKNSIETQNSIDTVSEYITKENDNINFFEYVFSPDSRDLDFFYKASGTVRADFIQPSLETLQPTIDDIFDPRVFDDYGMPDPIDFFSVSRLPPVPEEGTEDIYKNIDYRLQIMNSEPMDSTNISDVTGQSEHVSNLQNNVQQNLEPLHYTAKLLTQNINFDQNYNDDFNNEMEMVIDSYQNDQVHDQISPPPSNTYSPQLRSLDNRTSFPQKERNPRSSYKHLTRREPHNYDKIQPTVNQTLIYNQILAQSQQQNMYSSNYQDSNSILSSMHSSPIQTTTNNYNVQGITNLNSASQNILNLSNTVSGQTIHSMNSKYISQSGSLQNLISTNQTNLSQKTHTLVPLLSVPMLSLAQQHSPPSMNTMHLNDTQDSFKAATSHQLNSQSESYKPYPSPHTFKSNSSGYSNVSLRAQLRNKSPPSSNILMVADSSNQQQSKEMFRSHSLPLNAKLQFPKEEFVVPKYQSKPKPTRSRSNSMVIKNLPNLPALQSATSEPVLNTSNSALLQQLLTSTNNTVQPKLTAIQPAQMAVIQPVQNVTNIFSQKPPTQPQVQNIQPKSPVSYSNTSNNITGNSSKVNFTASQMSPLTTTPTLSPEMITDVKSPSQIANIDSPMSPSRSSNLKYPRETQRRAGHIHAEQKRRYNIKNGFDTLHSLIPQLQQNPNAKLSKAAMLQKGADYIKQLRNERQINSEQMEHLKRERDSLNNSLNHLHSILPANGAPVSRQRTGRMKEMYDEYVHQRTLQNWKFWIFGLIFEPLISSFNSTVSVAGLDELYRTAKLWVDQNCSLVELRPAVSNKLRYLSTTTDILSDPPSTLQDEVVKAISSRNSLQQS